MRARQRDRGHVSGTTGILAVNSGSGTIGVTANGTVTGSSGDGIYAQSAGGPLAITVAATGTVSSTGAAAIETKGAAATVTVAGTVNGGGGGAIKFDQAGVFANRLELVTGAVVNGNVLGGPGTDTLGLSGSGTGGFNVAQLSSFEAGAKTGSGSWTLTGANTGITAFSVGGGTLFVNGSLSNAAFTVNGGTLGGTGTVGNTQINAGGTFAPGSGSPGSSMTVNGTLGFNSAATYAVHLDSATSSFASVTGTATLGSATVNAIFANGISQRYTILTAGTRSGTFGTLTNTNLPTNFHDTLSYDATHAYLNLTLAFQPPGGLNDNQQAVADTLTNFFNSNGSIPAVFGSLNANGLSQVSGESATGSQQTTFNAMGLFMGLLTDPFIDGRGDGPGAGGGTSTATGYASTQKPAAARDAYAMFTKAPPAVIPFAQRWSVWAAGYGGSQTTDGNAALGSNTATSRIAGMAVGADYRISPFTIAGFALAGGGTNFSVNTLGSGRSDLFQAGAFIRHTVGPAYLSGRAGLWLAGHHHQSHRDGHRRRSIARGVQGQRLVGPRRGRLSFRFALDRRYRPHALCRRPVHHLRPAGLRRAGGGGRQHLRAGLRLEKRDRHAQRTRPAHRQILRDAEWHLHAAYPFCLGARLQSGSRHRRDLPDAARRELRRERRTASERLRADDRLSRNEMDEWLVRGCNVRGRVLQRHPQLCRQGCPAIYVVSRRIGEFRYWHATDLQSCPS